MYPFVRDTDYLQLESHRTCEDEGENWINIREDWHNLDDITRENIFTSINSGLTISGSWLIDRGDGAAKPSLREKRAFCRKGKATLTFTGTSIAIRIYTNPLYGSADVRIDGVLPSTLANVKDAVDILSCDAYDHDETWGQEYLDIVIANNISDEEHTVELYAENTGSGVGGWFVIAGFKVADFASKTKEHDSWIMSEKSPVNLEELTFQNRAIECPSVYNISIVFGSFFVYSNGNPVGTIDQEVLWRNENLAVEFYPNIQGNEQEQTFSDTFEITASYENPNGAIEKDWGNNFVSWYDSESYEVHGVWYECLFGGGCGYGPESYLKFNTFGTYLDFTFLSYSFGGKVNVYVDDVYVTYYNCYEDQSEPTLSSYKIEGLSNTDHVVKIYPRNWIGMYSFISCESPHVRYYTEVIETITYNFPSYQVPPFAPENPRFLTYGDKNPTCDPVDTGIVDVTIPRDNADVSALWLEKRPATFAVCYQAGFEEILKSYDIVIVEPKALTRTIVKEYQDIGVKVICYCSYGEESGTYENEWDFSSATVPFTGNGNGPGGYASYYNKGENQFGECSECKHDRRRIEGITECALEQTAYYAAWAGRCSNACTKDWRTGYETYILGWNCGGGYNRDNNWSRTATKACTNSECPQYNAVKGACPHYETPDEAMYGQDYSIFTADWPDENGIWKSFYANPREQSWNDRLKEHYLSVMFDEGVEYTETVSVNTFPTSSDEITVSGFKVANVPVDSDEDIAVTHIAEDFTYVRGQDYIFDLDLGTFTMQVSSEGAPPAPWGTKLSVTYTRKGLQADGVFLDTLDTVDVYTSDEYRDAMVAMISEHHALYPDKLWAMNRGFTILEKLMPFADFVMFETFITTINWDTGEYYEITDEVEIAANQVFIDQLFALREKYTFNVLGLNYCAKNDEALKQLIAEKVRALGWLSWNSTISLNDPQENEEIFTKNLYIESNAWRLTDELNLP